MTWLLGWVVGWWSVCLGQIYLWGLLLLQFVFFHGTEEGGGERGGEQKSVSVTLSAFGKRPLLLEMCVFIGGISPDVNLFS